MLAKGPIRGTMDLFFGNLVLAVVGRRSPRKTSTTIEERESNLQRDGNESLGAKLGNGRVCPEAAPPRWWQSVHNRATVRGEHRVNPAVAALKRDRIAVIVVPFSQVAAHEPGTVQEEPAARSTARRLANSSGVSLPAIAFDTRLQVAHDPAIVRLEKSLGKPAEA